ncbi:transposase [bacterium]|nr:transposase [bacterium]
MRKAIETHGNFLSLNPHVHVLITDGLFCDNGDFLKMPKYSEVACKYLKTLWEKGSQAYCRLLRRLLS